MEKVCVLGLGYIGLPTACLLAAKGFKVHGVDVDSKVVAGVNRGNAHINEPELDDLVRSVVQRGNLTASREPAPADIFIVAVPTPIQENHLPDISYIKAAAGAMAPYLAPGNLVILESTCPVGTTEKMAGWLRQMRPELTIPSRSGDSPVNDRGAQIYIAHCPERVLPGQVLKELIDNDRIIGGIDRSSAAKAQRFYQTFVKGETLVTCSRTAELAKLAENSFRDVNIAFANELAIICNKLGIDVWELIELANRHPRVNILKPGPGVGGHCIAVDPWFIVSSAPGEARLIRMARTVNDSMPHNVVAQIKEKVSHLKHPVVTCLGLTYKANVRDLRESPALKIVKQLAEEEAMQILVVEPYVDGLPGVLEGRENITLTDLNTGLEKADLVVLLVDHQEFIDINHQALRTKMVTDTRGVWR